MPADTAAKRYSAMNMASPWRGLNVVPDAAIPQGERQAAMFFYSGILAVALTATAFWKIATRRGLAGTAPERRGNRPSSVNDFATRSTATDFTEDRVTVDEDL